ncbi:MAG: hypothetical protein DWH82_09740 [Planctomycetota bacterium]|nr:MAG: hypothetical protein DWH82_09740 [Planctomycetota bacterium]
MAQDLDLNPKRLSVPALFVSATEGNVSVQAAGLAGVISLESQAILLNSNSAFLSLSNSETGGGASISASGANAAISLSTPTAEAVSALTITPAGILLAYGAPGLVGAIQMVNSSLILSMGVPGVGPIITMTPTSLTFQVGPTIMTLTALGVVTTAASIEMACGATDLLLNTLGVNEVVGQVSRVANAVGHTLSAAESKLTVDMSGLVVSAPIGSMSFSTLTLGASTTLTVSADAMQTVKSPYSTTG